MYLNNEPVLLERSFKYYSWQKENDLSLNLAPLLSERIRYNSIFEFNDEFDSKIIIKKNDSILQDFTELLLKWIDSSRKVACFTVNCTSPYMWGQYASKNTGFMLEYSDLKLHKITYSTSPIVYLDYDRLIERAILFIRKNHDSLNITIDEIKKYVFDFFRQDHLTLEYTARAFLTKHIDWIYEQEYRCFLDILSGKLVSPWCDGIEIKKIESITFGTKFSILKSQKGELKDILNKNVIDKNVKLFIGEKDYGNNIIVQKNIEIDNFLDHVCV